MDKKPLEEALKKRKAVKELVYKAAEEFVLEFLADRKDESRVPREWEIGYKLRSVDVKNFTDEDVDQVLNRLCSSGKIRTLELINGDVGYIINDK